MSSATRTLQLALIAFLGIAFAVSSLSATPALAGGPAVTTNDENIAHGRRVEVQGTIIAVDRGGFDLRTERGDVRVAVNDRTTITINGRPARLGDLQPRDRAVVKGIGERTPRGFLVTARTVEARRR